MPSTTVPATRGSGAAVGVRVGPAAVEVGDAAAGGVAAGGVRLGCDGRAVGAGVVPLSPSEEHAASEIPALHSRRARRLVRTSTGRA
jgi:hypothetical protein